MLAASKPIVTAVLLGCLLLGMLFSFTAVNKTSGVASEQALRGGAIKEESSRALPEEGLVTPPQQQRKLVELPSAAVDARVDEDVAEGIEVPDKEEPLAADPDATPKEDGDGKKNVVFSWPEQAAESNGFWGPDNQERAQLAQFVAKGTWDRLDTVDAVDLSLSFSFEL